MYKRVFKQGVYLLPVISLHRNQWISFFTELTPITPISILLMVNQIILRLIVIDYIIKNLYNIDSCQITLI